MRGGGRARVVKLPKGRAAKTARPRSAPAEPRARGPRGGAAGGERIAIVGAGRAGSALAISLARAGWKVSAVASRRAGRARALARRCGAELATSDPRAAIRAAEVALIAVPDREIAHLAHRLASGAGRLPAGRRDGSPGDREKRRVGRRAVRRRPVALHTSGVHGAGLLAPLRKAGWAIGSLHPLMTFAGANPTALQRETATLPEGIAFAIDGDPEARRLARKLARSLGGRAILVPESHRVRYHLAACLASNYLVTVAWEAADLLRRTGMTRRSAVAALQPLMRATIENIARVGIPQALTGPVARGDAETIRRHAALLRRASPALTPLHRELVTRTVRLARSARWLDAKAARRLRESMQSGS